jgi:hypothetical protein
MVSVPILIPSGFTPPFVSSTNSSVQVFNSGSIKFYAHRFNFSASFSIQAMAFRLFRNDTTPINDSIEINMYADNGANYPDTAAVVVSNAVATVPPPAAAISIGYVGTSLTGLAFQNGLFYVGPVFDPAPPSIPSGIYWVVAHLPSGNTYSNLFTATALAQDVATPELALYGPDLATLTPAPIVGADTNGTVVVLGVSIGVGVLAAKRARAMVIG